MRDALPALNPDGLSPRDALEALYRLKSPAAKGRDNSALRAAPASRLTFFKRLRYRSIDALNKNIGHIENKI
jgi:hypothetical protein